MAVTATILIALGALMGIYMAITAVKSGHIPKGLALLHGFAVISGAVLLLIYAISSGRHWDSLIIFLIAAVGGVYIVFKDITHQPFPLWLIFAHGLIGLTGLIWLSVHLSG